MPGNSRPTVPALEMHRRVDRHDRRGFGRAVAFEDADAELLEPHAARLRLDALGAGEHVAHRVEVVVVRDPRVAGQERVGAEQDRRVDAVDELRAPSDSAAATDTGTSRTPGEQRQQQAARQPEAVKHRQRVEDDVLRIEVDDRRKLMAVGQQVAMAQHDALRRAFRSRREQHHRRLVGARRRSTGRPRSADADERGELRETMPISPRTSSR